MSDIVKREPVEMAGVKKSMSYEGEGVRGREEGRGRCGSHVVERDMRECGLKREEIAVGSHQPNPLCKWGRRP